MKEYAFEVSRKTSRWAFGWIVLGAGALGAGLLGQRVGVPAAWLVGPMVVAIAYALTKPTPPQNVPRLSRMVALSVIGTLLAASFQPSVLPTIFSNLPTVLLAIAGTLLLSLAGGRALSYVTGLDLKTAILGTLPGVAAGMIPISDSLGADTRLVALIQYSRVVLVILSASLISHFFASTGAEPSGSSTTAPASFAAGDSLLIYSATALVALIGSWGGQRLRIPSGTLIGPLILGVVLKELGILSVVVPFGMSQLAYAVLGVYVGLLFDSASIRRAGRVLPAVLACTLMLMVGCAGLGWVLSVLTGSGVLTSYLATTPGGLSSIAVIAVESGADPSLAVAVQMLRVFAVLFVTPLLTKWALSYSELR